MSTKADLDKHFFDSKQRTFLGTAKVSLAQLEFVRGPSTCREVDPKNVKRLLGIFKLEGCLRLEPDHSISATVAREAFVEALAKAGLTIDALNSEREPPLLDFPELSITCLYGRHRIAAAKQFLDSFEDWWVINFYDDVLDGKTLHSMRDEYSNAMNFCHGDIYRNAVAARRAGDEALEGRWLGRLNPSLRKDLGLFFKKEGYQSLRLALNSLLPFAGLWPSLRLGCLRRIFHLHQPEELAHYLETVCKIWSSILLNRNDLFGKLDHDTVKTLQLRNPVRYKADSAYIRTKMESGSIFAEIKDENIRSSVLEKLLAVQVCIPSIETFHEDTKWLEPCSAAIREHILPKSSSSLFRDLSRAFDYKQSMSNVDINKRNKFTLAYRKLFACAWRYFPELTGISPKQNQEGPKQLSKSRNDLVQYEFRKYATELGFRASENVDDIFDPEKVMIRKFLSNIRPPDRFRLSQKIEEHLINEIHTIIQNSYHQGYNIQKPSNDHKNTLDNRCGRPSFEVWNCAKAFFEYEHLYNNKNCGPFFADQRDIFMLFFGKHDGALPSRDAARSVAFSLQPAKAQTNNPVTFSPQPVEAQTNNGVADDVGTMEAQTATDFFADSSRTSIVSPVPLDLHFELSRTASKRRRENGEPIEKEARLDAGTNSTVTWYNGVLKNAKALKKIPDNASINSHIIVAFVNDNKINIRDRDMIADLLDENAEQSFCLETSSLSVKGKVYDLKSISRETVKHKRRVASHLLLGYKPGEHEQLLGIYRTDHERIWQAILDMSTHEESYFLSTDEEL